MHGQGGPRGGAARSLSTVAPGGCGGAGCRGEVRQAVVAHLCSERCTCCACTGRWRPGGRMMAVGGAGPGASGRRLPGILQSVPHRLWLQCKSSMRRSCCRSMATSPLHMICSLKCLARNLEYRYWLWHYLTNLCTDCRNWFYIGDWLRFQKVTFFYIRGTRQVLCCFNLDILYCHTLHHVVITF